MRVKALMAALIALCGCGRSDVDQAKLELATFENVGGTYEELCPLRRKLAAAYLKAGDQENFRFSRLMADSACLGAELEPQRRFEPTGATTAPR